MFPLPMQELLNQARLATLFGNPTSGAPNITTPAPQDDTNSQDTPPAVFSSNVTGIKGPDVTTYDLQTPISDRLSQVLQEMPKEGDYPTGGKGRRVLAGLISLRARTPAEQQETIDRVMHPEYYKAMGDWRTNIDALMKGSTDEIRINNLLRQAAHNTNQDTAAAYKAGTGARAQDARQKWLEWQQAHPKGKVVVQKGGNIMLLDENNELQDTGVPSGTLSDEDKIDLQTKGRLKEIGAQISGQMKEIGARGDESRKTKQTPSGNITATKPDTPTQEKIRMFNNAKKAVLNHPEWAPYIHFGGAGGVNDFSIDPPSTGHWYSRGPDQDTHDAIVKEVTGTPSATPTTKPATNNDEVTVIDLATGKKVTTIPRADVPRLNTKKYKVQEQQ